LDRLIVITGGPIAPVTGSLVFGNVPSYELVYGEPYLREFLNEKTDIPYSGFLGLEGSIVVQYNDINAENEFVDTDIFFTTTSISAIYGNEGGDCFTQADLDAQYEAGKQYCINSPEECGLRSGKAAFTGELAEKIQSYLTLTEDSVPFYLSPGSYAQTYGSNGTNTLNVEEYARLKC
jgi:hypothetical protein